MMKRPSIAALAVLALATAAAPFGGAASEALGKPPRSGRAAATVGDDDPRVSDTVRAVRRARASTVNIHSQKRAAAGDALFPAGRDRKVNGMGTGIVVDERGYIVTNHHVVLDVDALRVTLFDGSSHTARVVSFDRRQDLAIIKIEAGRPLPTMPIGTSSDLLLGEDILAIGNAFGYEHTVTRGIVSSLSRDVEVNAEQSYENLIQIDAAINPGNSGGPLINARGDVVGINVAIRAGAQKIGFAIPIDDARRVIARLMSVEQLEQKFHGVVFEDRKEGPVRELIVSRVTPGSPAAKAGLRRGDVVEQIAGRDTADSADFERLLLGRPVSEQVAVRYRRGGRPFDATVQLASTGRGYRQIAAQTTAPTPPPVAKNTDRNPPAVAPSLTQRPVSTEDSVWETFGLKLATLDDRAALAGTDFSGGMTVLGVRPNSPASREHIRKGDILVGLNSYEVSTLQNIAWVIRHQKDPAAPLRFYVRRGGETLYGHFKTQVASR